MNAELVFFGHRVSMAQRYRRRALVVSIYASLALLMAVLWFTSHWHGTGAYVFWAAIIACRLFLGGNYAGGLVKPFNGAAPRQNDMPPPLLALKLRLYQPVLAADESKYRNDEREQHQRDWAHYKAYQTLGVVMCALWALSLQRIVRPELLNGIGMSPDEMYFGLLLIVLTLFLTLPQAILLWTEPDMEPETEMAV
jgi:hypothetical protein